MGTIPVGTCPSCKKIVRGVEADGIDISVNLMPQWKGVAYHCQSCRAVLGVEIDPVALKADILAEIKQLLSGRH